MSATPHSLLGDLGRRVLIGSGAMGTCLRGAEASGDAIELLNLSHPETVRALHRSYREAGSQILVTNTFAANRLALAESGQADLVTRLNEVGVQLAREAAGADAMVWASVGPLALGLQLDDFTAAQLRAVYDEPCRALAAADALVLETFTNPREAAAALDAAAATGLPVIFQIGHVGGGQTEWSRIDALVELALRHGVAALGTNCRHPADTVRAVEALAARTDLPLTASTNAGHPRIDRGRVTYDFTPADLRETGERLWRLGATVIGGCCGTTPEHIRALAAALRDRPPAPRSPAACRPHAGAGAPGPRAAANPIRERLAAAPFLVSVEVRADRKATLASIVAGAARLAEAGADLLDVPDNPGATVGRDAAVVAARLQQATGLPAIPHKSVTQCNLLQLHSSLIGAWDLGLRGVLAITGDPPSTGHLGGMAGRVSDVKSSVELLRLVRTLRGGRMINGEEVADPPDLCAGCAFGTPTPAQVGWLRKKQEAGAEFVFTQPVFTLDDFRRLRDAATLPGMRLFPGLMPLTGRRNAEFFASGRIPGIKVPPEVVESFARFESPADQRRFGLEQAAELARAMRREAAGMYLIMPFGRDAFAEAADLVRIAKRG